MRAVQMALDHWDLPPGPHGLQLDMSPWKQASYHHDQALILAAQGPAFPLLAPALVAGAVGGAAFNVRDSLGFW